MPAAGATAQVHGRGKSLGCYSSIERRAAQSRNANDIPHPVVDRYGQSTTRNINAWIWRCHGRPSDSGSADGLLRVRCGRGDRAHSPSRCERLDPHPRRDGVCTKWAPLGAGSADTERLPAIQFRTSCRSQPRGRPWNLALAGNLPVSASSSSTQRGRWVIRATSRAESRSRHGGGPSLTHLDSTTSAARAKGLGRVSEVRPVPVICSPCKVWFPTNRDKISLGQEHFMRRQTRQHGYRGNFGRLSPRSTAGRAG